MTLRTGLEFLSRQTATGTSLLRLSVAIVFIWIGFVKFAPYEADSITPLVAQSPLLSYFYQHPEAYRAHLTREGELVPEQRAWQQANNTYGFSNGLGLFELFIALCVLANPWSRRIGLLGGVLTFLTPFVTLSFLLTTREAWVPALGDLEHGFPYLSGVGRLIIKDTMMLAAGVVIMADSAQALLKQPARARSRITSYG